MREITFEGIITKATTTIDGGWRISIDLSDDQSDIIPNLIHHKEELLQFAAIPFPKSGAV